MEYYVDKNETIAGRLYKCGKKYYMAETGRKSDVAMGSFVGSKGLKTTSYCTAQRFLYQNGCVRKV